MKELQTFNDNKLYTELSISFYINTLYCRSSNIMKKIIKKYDNVCQNIINLDNIKIHQNQKKLDYLKTIDDYFKQKSNMHQMVFGVEFYKFSNIIKKYNNKSNLIITNNYGTVNYAHNMLKNIDILSFYSEEYTMNENEKFITDIKENKKRNLFFDFKANDFENMFKINKKYDMVLCRESEFLIYKCEHYYKLTRIPNFIFMITKGLQSLNKNGDMLLFTRLFYLTPTHKKILHLLANSFKNIDIKLNDSTNNYNNQFLIHCQGFKDNITKHTLNKLIDITINSRKYNYSVCQVMQYMYHISKTQSNNALYDIYNYMPKTMKSLQTTMSILDDINIQPTKTKDGELLIYQLEKMYNNYFINVNYNSSKYITRNNNSIKIDDDFMDKIIYDRIVLILNILKENNIPVNKAFLAYVDKYDKSTTNSLYSLQSPPIYSLLKYEPKTNMKTAINKLKLKKDYHYNELNTTLKQMEYNFIIKQTMIEKTQPKDLKIVKTVSEDFARGVSKYLNTNYKLDYKVSNAFLKLWEIYSLCPSLISNKKKNVKIFHFCEAPGNWIYCTNYFIINKRENIDNYDWCANSLNPNSKENIRVYGRDKIFSDDYGFMKKYPNKWLFGADNTGDITKPKNIHWFLEYINKWIGNKKLDLITGDAGLNIGDSNLLLLQKLDLAQMIVVAYCSSIGGNCVIKHFMPFINSVPKSYLSSGYFVSYLYVYYLMFETVKIVKPYTSNPNSGEFYLVGLKFRGISDNIKNKLLDMLDKFQENDCLFEQKDIPETFSNQIIDFINNVNKKKIIQFDLQNALISCMIYKDEKIKSTLQCNKYLNMDYIKSIQEVRFKEWVKMYKI